MTFKKLLIIFGLLVAVIAAATLKIIYNVHTRPGKLSSAQYGHFPLYEKGFSKTISMRQPARFILYVSIVSELEMSVDTCDTIVMLEVLKNGQFVHVETVAGTSFRKLIDDKKDDCLEKSFELLRFRLVTSPVTLKHLEKVVYRVTVVQPCMKYENLSTELYALMFN